MTKFVSVTQQLSDCRAGNKGGGIGHSYLNKHYCWSYGYCSNNLTYYCKVPNMDHQRRAKASEIMGGFQANKPR